jgi:hypothetical protein
MMGEQVGAQSQLVVGRFNRAALVAPALVVLVLAGFLVQALNAQAASRYGLTGAIWDDHSVSLDGYPIGSDRAEAGGHTFSDKAPGQPLLAVPVYAAYRLVGGEPARTQKTDENLGLWWVTLWSATIPAAALVAMMTLVVGDVSRTRAAAAALLTWGGTILAPFSTVLFGHVLATAFLFGTLVVIYRYNTFRTAVAAGLLAGLAVLTEYTAVLGVVVLGVWILVRHRPRLLGFIAGGLSPVLVLLIYNLIAFGSPWTISYQFNAFHDVSATARPLLHMFTFESTLENATQLLFGPRGFFLATPLVVIGLWGLISLARSGPRRDIGWLGLAMFAVFLLIPLFWGNPWGGDSPGPRYMTPAMAFLAPGIAVGLTKARLFTVGAAVASCVTMGLATLTNPVGVRADDRGGLGSWIRLGLDGQWAPNLATIGFGRLIGTLVYAAAAVLVFTYFVRTAKAGRAEGELSSKGPAR